MSTPTSLGALALTAALLGNAPAAAQTALSQRDSPHAFAATVQRIEQAIAARGLTLFAKVDHAAAAQQAGLALRPTTLLMFGNPKGGTPLMQAHPGVAIDLPTKALVWQADDGQVKVAVNPAEFYQRHGLSEAQAKPLGAAAALVEAALQ